MVKFELFLAPAVDAPSDLSKGSDVALIALLSTFLVPATYLCHGLLHGSVGTFLVVRTHTSELHAFLTGAGVVTDL